MRHTTGIPATLALNVPLDLLAIYPITPALPTARRRPVALLHTLSTWVSALTRRCTYERQDIRPDFPRQETPTDLLARKHTFLYACSLSG